MPSTRRWTKQKWIDKSGCMYPKALRHVLNAPRPAVMKRGLFRRTKCKKRQIALPSYPTKGIYFIVPCFPTRVKLANTRFVHAHKPGMFFGKTASSSCPMPGRQASIHNRQLRKSSRCLTTPPLRSAFLWSILTISGRTIMLYRGIYRQTAAWEIRQDA